MIKIYSFLFILLFSMSLIGYSQGANEETVGNPTTTTPVNQYTGWTNQGILTYSGNAMVQNTNPSNYPTFSASAGGNVFFTNTPGTNFLISGFDPSAPQPDGIELIFGMSGYDTANPILLNKLVLSVSRDSGITWSYLPYHRLFSRFYPPAPWDIFETSFANDTSVNGLIFSFEQTTSTDTFRIDDISISFILVLPIKLKHFSATVVNKKTVLNWNATTSSDKEVFVVEKSTNGEQFYPLKQLSSKGNGQYDYEYADGLNRNKNFYRLKMITTDGKSSYSGIVETNLTTSSDQLIQAIYPVPAKDVLNIKLNCGSQQKITLSLVNQKGQLRLQKSILLSQGINNYVINIQELIAGTYYLTATSLEGSQTQKITIIK